MSLEASTILTALVLFLGSLTRSTFGFGEALVTMPLLSMLIGVQSAAAVVAITSVLNATALLLTDARSVEWRPAWRMVVASLVGIPLGVRLLITVDEKPVKLFLAVLVIGFALYNLLQPRLIQLKRDAWAYPFGFIAGILGGAYNTMGPPMVIFGTLRGWSAREFRMTLQAIFLPASLFIALNHGVNGLWTTTVWSCLLLGVPAIVIAVAIGRRLNEWLDGERFSHYVSVLLLIIGVSLIVNLLRG